MLKLKKRERQRSGIRHYPQREWPRHRRFVKSFHCAVWQQTDLLPLCDGVVEFSHCRSAATAGTSLKSHDWHGVPLCSIHHAEYHRGDKTFESKYRIDLWALAAELADKSPDAKMRETMKAALDPHLGCPQWPNCDEAPTTCLVKT